jgi:hypothetical protein
MSTITVMDVFRALNIEPDPNTAWMVGARVRERWRQEAGALPPKGLRRKTSGGGTHCFALYPAEWRPLIEAEIRSVGAEAAKQAAFEF